MSNRTVGGNMQRSFKRVAVERIREACLSTTELLENRQLLSAVLAPIAATPPMPNTPTSGETFYMQGVATVAPSNNASAITPVTTNDLILNQYADTVSSGTAQAGTSNTITLSASDTSTAAQIVGLRLELKGGTGAGQSAIILAYNPASKIATISANTSSPAANNNAWTTAPDNTTQYQIVNSNYAGTFESLGGDLTPLTNGNTGTPTDDPSSAANALFDRDVKFQVTYTLGGATPSATGYDISEIQSIAGHQDPRYNQSIDILVQYAGSDNNFYSLSAGRNFSYAGATTGPGSTQLDIIDSSGAGNAIVHNVRAIRFVSQASDPSTASAPSPAGGGTTAIQGPVYRELSVIGTPSATAATPPASAPVLTGNVSNGADLNLSWTDSDTNVTGYKVLRSADGVNFTPIALVPATQTTYTDEFNQYNATFSYEVVATNSGADSPASNIVALTTNNNFGLTARFYGQQFWQGPVLATQTLPVIDQNHNDGTSPIPGTVPDQNASAVFTGKVRTDAAGAYTFISNTDDDGYLYVNGVLASSDPGGHGQRDPAASRITAVQLQANTQYDIVFLQNQGGGGQGFHLLWREPIVDPVTGNITTGPEVIVPGDHLSPAIGALPSVNSLSAIPTSNAVNLFMTTNPTDSTSFFYKIERETVDGTGNPVAGAQWITVGQPRSVVNPLDANNQGVTNFTDTTVTPGQDYIYRVTIYGFDGTHTDPTAASTTPVVPVPLPTQFSGVEERDYNNLWWYSNGDPRNIEITSPADVSLSETGPIDFKWNQGGTTPLSPDPRIPATNWSNVYTGKILTDQAGVYTLITNSDDDGYLWFNDGSTNSWKLVSQDPGGHGERDATTLVPVTLAANTSYNFIFLHSQGGGGAGAHLKWAEPAIAGTATGGTLNSITIPTPPASTVIPVGAVVTITGGTGKGQTANVTSFDSSTNTVNIDTWVTNPAGGTAVAPDNTSTYSIVFKGLIPNAGGVTPGSTGGLLQVMDTPAAPTNLTNPAVQLEPNFVGLTWTDNAKSEINYVIERATSADFTQNDSIVGKVGLDATSFVDGTVQPGTTYYYRVYAKNFDGQSSAATLTVTTPTVAVQAPGTEQHLYNDQYWKGNNGDPLAINQSGNPDVASLVTKIDRDYGNFAPDARIRITQNSQVFTGQVVTDQAGVYTFVSNNDDSGYLFISDKNAGWQLVSSDPGGHGQQDASQTRAQDYLVPVTLAANTAYNFVFFANQGTGGQGAHLKWTEPVAATGTAQGPGTGNNTIILAGTPSTATNAFVGDTITITGGTGKAQAGVITAYDPATGTATVNVTTGGTGGHWTTAPDNTSTYTVQYLNGAIPPAGSTNSAGGATNGGGLQILSDTPAAPATLSAIVGSNAVQLTWTEPGNGSELSWVVERATQPDFSDAAVIGTAGMTLDKFTDTNVTAGATYYYRVHGTNFDGSGAASTVTATTIAAASGGSVTASAEAINGPNLTNYGIIDWAHWATNSAGEFDHKAAGGNQISDVTVLGAPTELQSPPLRNSQGGFPNASWSDNGLLDRTNGGNGNGVMVHDLNDGLELTAPADATTRVLRLWVAVTNGTGTLTARLSDGSAVATQTISNTGNAAAGQTTRQLVSLVYSAPASSGNQFLIVDYKLTTDNGGGNVAISSASLSSGTEFLAPSNVSAAGRCSDGEMDISWSDNTQNPINEGGFEIQYSSDGGTTFNTLATVPADVTTYHVSHDQGLVPTQSYVFRVRALGAGTQPNSPFSANATAAPMVIPINFTDFNSGTGILQKNGNGNLNTGTGGNPAKALELTANSGNQTTSVFTTSRYDVSTFDTTFDFEFNHLASNPVADGFTFTIQTSGANALGGGGGNLGYQGIANSVAVKFDLYNNVTTTGLYTGGNAPNDNTTTTPGTINNGYDMTGAGLNWHTNFADKFEAHITYDGTTLTESVKDLTTSATFTMNWTINVPQVIGNKCAFIGFTGATGGASAQQDILNWKFTPAAYVPVVTGPPISNTIGGTAGNDTILIKKDADGTHDDIWVNVASPSASNITQEAVLTSPIVINGGGVAAGGTDTLIFDSTNGQPIPSPTGAAGIRLNAGTGNFTLGGTPPTLDATHVVDVGTSTVNIPYTGSSILPAVQGYLAGGAIKSTEAAASSGKFAVADTDTGSQITLNYLVIGDLNGDGAVNFNDLLALAQHYGNTGVDWSKGDLNYDGTVNFNDLLALAQHYGQSSAAAVGATPLAAASSAISTTQNSGLQSLSTLDNIMSSTSQKKPQISVKTRAK